MFDKRLEELKCAPLAAQAGGAPAGTPSDPARKPISSDCTARRPRDQAGQPVSGPEGSVRVAGGRMRVTTQLIDAETGKHIWADRYDRELRPLRRPGRDHRARPRDGRAAPLRRGDLEGAQEHRRLGLVARAVVMLN